MFLILNDTKGEFAVQKSMQRSVFLVKGVSSNAMLVFFYVLECRNTCRDTYIIRCLAFQLPLA